MPMIENFLDGDEAVCMTDCTGLMTTIPEDEEQNQSYNDILPTPKQRGLAKKS